VQTAGKKTGGRVVKGHRWSTRSHGDPYAKPRGENESVKIQSSNGERKQ